MQWREVENDFPLVLKYDLLNVRLWPEVLAEVGYEVYHLNEGASSKSSAMAVSDQRSCVSDDVAVAERTGRITMNGSECTEFLVMRHGQTEADMRKTYSCREDPLTKKGLHDAQLAARWITNNYPPTHILSSPLVRARRTADEAAQLMGLQVDIYDDLRERDNGELACQTKDNANVRFYGPDETAPGGETLNKFRERAEAVWTSLLKRAKPGERILIVSHGQMIGMLFRCFLNRPKDDSIRLRTSDTGIHCWRVDGSNRTVVFCNRQTHMSLAER